MSRPTKLRTSAPPHLRTFSPRHGGDLIVAAISRWGTDTIFTLVGGHISPILVGAQDRGLKVIDCRDERNAVFAADAYARVSGLPGVAAVTAGPGVTNAITALKNAQLAQSPLVLFGGATATVLRGRGALQDIDQLALVRSAVKWSVRCTTVGQLTPAVERAFKEAVSGVPGPVFVEVPVDLLYPESVVREWFMKEGGVEHPKSLGQRAVKLYLAARLLRQFHAPPLDLAVPMPDIRLPKPMFERSFKHAVELLEKAERPALVIGSQTMANCRNPVRLAHAVERLGIPTWLGGMARGLLGQSNHLQFRHARGQALKDADLVITCGFPFDFRLKYGAAVGKRTKVIAANLSSEELTKNRWPAVSLQMRPSEFLVELSERVKKQPDRAAWFGACAQREAERDAAIRAKAKSGGPLVDPLRFFLRLEEKMAADATIVADGGDFVATAANVLRPRQPLGWLDPGVFGTLGVGGGFALGALAARPKSETWIVYGDGSSAYSLAEFDTFVRHGFAPIAVIGTDASWAQIARDQIGILGSDVATKLRRTDYQKVAEGYGGIGLLLTDPQDIDAVLDEAKFLAQSGRPVCINVHLAKTDFRDGAISI